MGNIVSLEADRRAIFQVQMGLFFHKAIACKVWEVVGKGVRFLRQGTALVVVPGLYWKAAQINGVRQDPVQQSIKI